jgi:hypothetical protein
MTRKATPKKKPAEKAKVTGRKKSAKAAAPRRARTPTARRTTAFVVQRKTYGVYGDTLYTEPDRVFATEEAAEAHAEVLNRELVRLGEPFALYDVTGLIAGGDAALAALVEQLNLPQPTGKNRRGRPDWAGWWNEHSYNLSDDQRDSLCRALDRFEWYRVRTTTLE